MQKHVGFLTNPEPEVYSYLIKYRKSLGLDYFHINDWGSLQKSLKNLQNFLEEGNFSLNSS